METDLTEEVEEKKNNIDSMRNGINFPTNIDYGKLNKNEMPEGSVDDRNDFSPFDDQNTDNLKYVKVTARDHLRQIPIDKYIRCWGNFGKATNTTCEQGKLVSVDWEKNTLVLHNTVYNNTYTIDISMISSIEANHTDSGSSSSAQTPDWKKAVDKFGDIVWVKSNQV